MAITRNLRTPNKETYRTSKNCLHYQQPHHQNLPPHHPPSWAVMKSILTCKHLQVNLQHDSTPQNHKQQKLKQKQEDVEESTHHKKSKKMRCSGSLCSNTKVMIHKHTIDPTPPSATSSHQHDIPSRRIFKPSSSSLSSLSSHGINEGSGRSIATVGGGGGISFSSTSSSSNSATNNSANGKGMLPFRRLSGCYECRMVVDPVTGYTTRDASVRSTVCSCPDCGEIFMKTDYLEIHQSISHAVSELGPEDTSKNIVEIIFQSSWLQRKKKPSPIPLCKIDRILKIHNTSSTIKNFENYRDTIKSKANKHTKRNSRCIADGNELLRFHCTTFICSLGLNGSSNLCDRVPDCGVCSVVRDGFRFLDGGILTTASSGRAHDRAEEEEVEGDGVVKRAMLVCRVIAGRVMRSCVDVGSGKAEEYDSIAGAAGVYSGLDELYVFNPKAILPCFVVVYTGV